MARHHIATKLSILLTVLCIPVTTSGQINGWRTTGRQTIGSVGNLVSEFDTCTAEHTINNWRLGITAYGLIGDGNSRWDFGPPRYDCLLGELLGVGSEYPKGSKKTWIDFNQTVFCAGGVVGSDTLASFPVKHTGSGVSREMAPDEPIMRLTAPHDETISDQDIITVYSDTLTGFSTDYWTHRPHKPLPVRITQRSYAWTYEYAKDFIIFDFRVRNIGENTIKGFWFGVHGMPACGYDTWQLFDDVVGWISTQNVIEPCQYEDTIQVAWLADNDGDPIEGVYEDKPVTDPADGIYKASVREVAGFCFLETKPSGYGLSWNWWTPFLQPQHKGDYRTFRAQDTPIGDKELYWVMSNGEKDHDQIITPVITAWDPVWKYYSNREAVESITAAAPIDFILSTGGLDLAPGAVWNVALALVGGENLHSDPNNYANLPQSPQAYRNNLDFSDLIKNVHFARHIYDNPGIDTDGDGYKGEFRVCVRDSALVNGEWVVNRADTQWYKGDGIPDYRGALPPPAPSFWLTPTLNGVHVRFNGQVTETEKDIFLQKPDFEGYRVYLGRDERESSLQLVGSYDLEDYDKYYLDLTLEQPTWQLEGEPYSKDELRCLYGQGMTPCEDSTFEPLGFTQLSPYRHPQFPNDSVFWFKKHEYNASEFGVNTPIKKRFPNVPDPRKLPADSITDEMYTEDGYLKFYEYEMTIENLLPTVEYWVNVTAFDYGSPAQGVNPLETKRTDGVRPAYPLTEHDAPISGSEQVYVYPNPYRVDANYRADGYEGRNQDDRWDERVRAIWFANLPPVCTISIYTIDGDRVRTMDHTSTSSDPTHRRKQWDLINRNFQKVETGLYYWVVEVPGGRTQMGKLAIIR